MNISGVGGVCYWLALSESTSAFVTYSSCKLVKQSRAGKKGSNLNMRSSDSLALRSGPLNQTPPPAGAE